VPGTAEGSADLAVTFSYTLVDTPSLKPAPPPAEVCRVVLETGVVVCRYADGSVKALLRDGNLCERAASGEDPLRDSWVVTNSNGLRVGTTDSGDDFYVAPVAVSSSTDPVTHHVMTTRADGTLVISRADGSRLVQFTDGTSIDSSAEAVKFGDRGEVNVSREGYPPVKVYLKAMEVEVEGLDGTILKAELQKPGHQGCVKLNHLDGSVLKLSSVGKLALFPAALAWGSESDGKLGVYSMDLAEGKLVTKDHSGSTFTASVLEGHTIDLVLKDDLAGELEAAAAEGVASDSSPQEEENADWSHPPRLFVTRPDGSGVELLRAADVRGFIRQREAEVEGGTAMLLREPLPAEPSAEVYTYVWRDWMQMHISALEADRQESDAITLLGFMPNVVASPPESTILHFRRLLRREALSESNREKLNVEIANMNSYREQEEQKAHELHVGDVRTAEEVAVEAELAKEMLKIFPMTALVGADGRTFLSS